MTMPVDQHNFKYPPLIPRTQSIRLLHLDRGSNGHNARRTCTLKSYDVAACPRYRALSYTWENPFPEDDDQSGIQDWNLPVCTIYCNEKPFYVRQNLYDALEVLVLRDLTGFYWIDSISIDQTDTAERETQIATMGDIFAGAIEVVCWLGRADAHLENVVELHHRLSPLMDSHGLNVVAKYSPADVDMISCSQVCENGLSESVSSRTTEALCESYLIFWRRRWFNRLWVAQEVTLARSLRVLCGNHEIPWHCMKHIAEHCSIARFSPSWSPYYSSNHRASGIPGRGVRRFMRMRNGQRQDIRKSHLLTGVEANQTQIKYALLLDTLVVTSGLYTTDPLDKVYGILGIVSRLLPDVQLASLKADYSIPPSSLFTRVASALITGLPYLSLLGKTAPWESTCEDILPSWVPDFASSSFGQHAIAKRTYTAGIKAREQNFRTVKDGQLMLRGRLLDTVFSLCTTTTSHLEDVHFVSAATKHSVLQPNIFATYFRTKTRCREKESAALSNHQISIFKASVLEQLRAMSSNYKYADAISEIRWSLQKASKIVHGENLPSEEEIEVWSTPDKYQHLDKTHIQEINRLADVFFASTSRIILSLTQSGLLVGTLRQACQVDDQVWIIQGAQVPIVLRPVPNSTYFTLVGEAYVDGVMFGEALEADDCPEMAQVTII